MPSPRQLLAYSGLASLFWIFGVAPLFYAHPTPTASGILPVFIGFTGLSQNGSRSCLLNLPAATTWTAVQHRRGPRSGIQAPAATAASLLPPQSTHLPVRLCGTIRPQVNAAPERVIRPDLQHHQVETLVSRRNLRKARPRPRIRPVVHPVSRSLEHKRAPKRREPVPGRPAGEVPRGPRRHPHTRSQVRAGNLCALCPVQLHDLRPRDPEAAQSLRHAQRGHPARSRRRVQPRQPPHRLGSKMVIVVVRDQHRVQLR